jgi:hypothetical protein
MSDNTPQKDTTSQKDEVRTTFNTLSIKEHIVMINEHIKKMELEGKTDVFQFELELLEVFPEFYDKYPFLVKKLCKRGDLSVLYKMIDNLEQIENGNKSMASVEMNLGEDLAKQYLYPSLKK